MSDSEDDCNEKRLNVAVLGEQNVGKTNLIKRFCHDDFSRIYVPTIGADFYIKRVTLSRTKDVIVRIADVSGLEMNGHMVSTYLFKTNIILLVYDITNMESFNSLNVWLKKINEIMNRYTEEENPTIAVMGNKCDLEHKRAMRLHVINQFAQENNLTNFSVSAKTGEKVNSSFIELIAAFFSIVLSDLEKDKEKSIIKAELISRTPQPIKQDSKRVSGKRKQSKLKNVVTKRKLNNQSCTIQ
ncbi:ras-related protein Rab-28 [Dendroctonus ponderosae]|uniref:Ras-related protein Rab-28 n=1 Tax=Dendroctonus ponderosae TaxID=77166 RepID=A0AAR5PIR8_DENPD|nr:ras-related protein Rab-28 [Dendroctonus ponderosae]KAH1015835.1 hypothetical protein HUJ04_007158 [Dendroctonus ponderosae]KAH1025104.1 hypothetical protein HUJ05_009897 [Dendroctonus ponderosae]